MIIIIIIGKYHAEPLNPLRAGVQLRHAEEDWDAGHGLSVQLRQFQHICPQTVDKQPSVLDSSCDLENI